MSYTPRSLKLLEMPYLCKKLGFNTIDDERYTGSLDYGYNSKVLVGNWLSERQQKEAATPAPRVAMDLVSTYRGDYRGERATMDHHGRDLWNNRLHGMGSVELGDGDHRMATVYDIAFRCKARDFVSGDYGSITGYGKKECLSSYWEASQNNDRSLRYHTEYRDAFSPAICLAHLTN